MIDIHCHIIYGVDDGPGEIEESLKMLDEAANAGIRVIFATPHFNGDMASYDKVIRNFTQLYQQASELGITLKLGHEVLINPYVDKLVKGQKIFTLGGSHYLLFEFPHDAVPEFSHEVIYKLQLEGIVPIIAHPERIRRLVRNFSSFVSLIHDGCLAQLDAGSILGRHGWAARRFAKHALRKRLIHFVASDAHRGEDYGSRMRKAYRKVAQWVGEEQAERLFLTNPKWVLEGELKAQDSFTTDLKKSLNKR